MCSLRISTYHIVKKKFGLLSIAIIKCSYCSVAQCSAMYNESNDCCVILNVIQTQIVIINELAIYLKTPMSYIILYNIMLYDFKNERMINIMIRL